MPTSEQKVSMAVQEQAADYYLALQDGTMTGAGLQEWQAWLAGSDAHRQAFARLETLWGLLETADEDAVAALPTSDISAEISVASLSGPVGGGSILAMVAPVASQTRGSQTSGRPKFSGAWLGSIAASVAAAFVAGYLMLAAPEMPAPAAATLYETAAGQQRVVNLADGSIVELDAGSAVSIAYGETERRLTLERGQAIFTVAKNPKRPFVVRAGQGSVTAIGTVFNVRKTSDDVEVRVLEGTVAVRPIADLMASGDGDMATSPVALVTAGRQTSYSHEGTILPVVAALTEKDLSWRVGVLTMIDLPIADVISELNRYLASEITIGDEAVGQLRFTGTVYPDQVQAWLDGLQEGYPIEVVRLGNSTILMMADDSSDTVVR